MPELPEVETVRRGLAPVMEGRRIRKVELRRKDLRFPFPKGFAQALEGRNVERLTRRAKYILIHLEGGLCWLVHLGMTGRFTVLGPEGTHNLGEFYYPQAASGQTDGPHDHVVVSLETGERIVYSDPRRFGFMDLLAETEAHKNKYLKNLGPEPLGNELNAASLGEILGKSRAPIKSALLDQRVIAGLGNIYVCEALHAAGISPRRKAGTLVHKKGPAPKLERLVSAIRVILEDAIRAGGSTLRDYAGAYGAPGAYQQEFAVYGREGEPCRNRGCTSEIRRFVQAGRSTFHCPACQR